MNRTVTWQITVQPWQVNRLITVRVSRATYTRHGRQEWELLTAHDVAPDKIWQGLHQAAGEVYCLWKVWRGLVDVQAEDDELRQATERRSL